MQSRTMSIIEMITGKVLGFVLFVAAQIIVLPFYYDDQVPVTDNMQIGLIFSAIAMVKSYGVRRFYNWWQWGRNSRHRETIVSDEVWEDEA